VCKRSVAHHSPPQAQFRVSFMPPAISPAGHWHRRFAPHPSHLAPLIALVVRTLRFAHPKHRRLPLDSSHPTPGRTRRHFRVALASFLLGEVPPRSRPRPGRGCPNPFRRVAVRESPQAFQADRKVCTPNLYSSSFREPRTDAPKAVVVSSTCRLPAARSGRRASLRYLRGATPTCRVSRITSDCCRSNVKLAGEACIWFW